MPQFSANLGFLFTELSLPEAIKASAAAGFAAVECHWPYSTPVEDTRRALAESGLSMLGLNTQRGNVADGDNGVSAIPGREDEARRYIDEAIDYAVAIACDNVHVMAGFSDQGEKAESTFRSNLVYASDRAAAMNVNLLIEPLNHYDAPGYHLSTLDAALRTLDAVGRDNLKIMFDCYHLQIMQGDLTRRLRDHLPAIGHIQIAGVPDRGEPDKGELHYPNLLATLGSLGWRTPIGAEYKPRNGTLPGLRWMEAYQ